MPATGVESGGVVDDESESSVAHAASEREASRAVARAKCFFMCGQTPTSHHMGTFSMAAF
jgi:hypothetical protein